MERVRLKLTPKRQRAVLEQPSKKWYRIKQPLRSSDYIRLRFYWITELYYIRARRKNGTATIKDVKAAQRCLAKVRKDET